MISQEYMLRKRSFFTPSCKHCRSAPFPGFSTSQRKLFHFILLKDLFGNTTEIPVWNLHGQHGVQFWTVSSPLLLTGVVLAFSTGSKKVDLYFLWVSDKYFPTNRLFSFWWSLPVNIFGDDPANGPLKTFLLFSLSFCEFFLWKIESRSSCSCFESSSTHIKYWLVSRNQGVSCQKLVKQWEQSFRCQTRNKQPFVPQNLRVYTRL